MRSNQDAATTLLSHPRQQCVRGAAPRPVTHRYLTTWERAWTAPRVQAILSSLDAQFERRRDLPSVPPDLEPAFRGLSLAHAALRRSEARVTFVGGSAAGTSSLINRLLGTPVVPTRTAPATGVITTVRHGATPGAAIVRRWPDGTLVQEPAPPHHQGRTIVLDAAAPGVSPDHLEELAFALPHPLLASGAALVDTPGLLGHPSLRTITLGELERADLAVMVLQAPSLLSEAECSAISTAHRLLNGNIVFVADRFDEVPARERAQTLTWARNGLGRCGNALVGRARLFATSTADCSGHPDDPGTAELRGWLADLLLGHHVMPLCLRARLGVLRTRAAAFRTQAEVALDDSRRLLDVLQRTEAHERDLQQAALREQVAEAHAALAKLRAHLTRRGHRLVNECVRDVDRSLAAGATSTEQLTACLTAAVEAYVKDVERGVKAATKYLQLPVPPFAGAIPAAGQITLAVDSLGNALGVVGGLLGLLALGVAGIFGVAVGTWLGGILAGDQHLRTREQARVTARQLVPALQAAAEQYLDRLDAAVNGYERLNQPSDAPSPALRSARARLRAQEKLIDWANGLSRAIAVAEGTLGA